MNRIMEITIDSFLGHTLTMTKEEIMAQRGQVLCEMLHIKLTMTPGIIRTEKSPVFKAMGEKIQAAFGLWDGLIIPPHFLDTITKAWKVAADLESRIHLECSSYFFPLGMTTRRKACKTKMY